MQTRQVTSFFIYFFRSVCNIHFWIWKYSQSIFKWSPLWFIMVCKISQIPQRLPIWTAHYTFLESTHPGVTKNLYYVLSTHWSQIPIFYAPTHWIWVLEQFSNFVWSSIKKGWPAPQKKGKKGCKHWENYSVIWLVQFSLMF